MDNSINTPNLDTIEKKIDFLFSDGMHKIDSNIIIIS